MASISSRTWTKQDGSQSERHQVTFVDNGGKRKRRDFTTKRLAQRFIENLAAYREAPKEPKAGPTFAVVTKQYMEACEQGRDGGAKLERKTLYDYASALRLHVLPILGKKPVGRLTATDMREFLKKIVAMDVSRRMMRLNLFLAKQVLKHARYLNLMASDPAADLAVKADRRREGGKASEVSIHTKDEMAAILTASRLLAGKMVVWKRFNVVLHVLVHTGLRMSELRGLPIEAVNFETGALKVYQRADIYGEIGPPKSQHSYRTIHLPAGVQVMLLEWIGARKKGLMFPTGSGKPISHSNLAQRMWRKAQVKADVTILNPHAARHFYASMLINGGTKLKALQETMGHHDPMFTMKTYGHLFTDPEDIALRQEMAARMEGILTAAEEED